MQKLKEFIAVLIIIFIFGAVAGLGNVVFHMIVDGDDTQCVKVIEAGDQVLSLTNVECPKQ